MDYFLSYRHDDSEGHTGRLHDTLAEDSSNVIFMDESSIKAGTDFPHAMLEAVRRYDVVIAVIGPGWLNASLNGRRRLEDPGDFVRQELATAIAEGIPLLCALVNGGPAVSASGLPADLRALARAKTFVLRDGGKFPADVASMTRYVQANVRARNRGGRQPASLRILNGEPGWWVDTSTLNVELDGKKIGQIIADKTIYSFAVEPGRRRLRFTRGLLFASQAVEIDFSPGQEVTVAYGLKSFRRTISVRVT